jgi:hypothetical protein
MIALNPLKNIKVVHDAETNQTWVVRRVLAGDTYGKDDCLTHEKLEPLVEFYDPRHPETKLGQFVSRYCLSTLLKGNFPDGLCLQGGVPSWSVSAHVMRQVQSWLSTQTPHGVIST